MSLAHRPARAEDIDNCFRMLQNGFAIEADIRARLPGVWRQLLADRSMLSAVVEDDDRRPGERIVGFGIGVFVTDEFAREARSNPAPYFNARIIRRHLRGDSPILGPAGIRRANSGDGLHAVVLHNSWPEKDANAEAPALVRNHLLQAYMELHVGYRIKEIVLEGSREEHLPLYLAGDSFRLITDYGDYYRRHSLPPPPPGERPCLVGVTREEVLANEMHILTPLFRYTPPVFYFRPVEQELLEHALTGETDEELAASLCVSLSAVKKRWGAIYERVAERRPELFPASHRGDLLRPQRGAEKRHHLLNYLRRHPEELRPIEPPRPRHRRRVAHVAFTEVVSDY